MAQTAAPVLRTQGLAKSFGNTTAVQDLTIELRQGEVLGFLGPNGSGKSTTIGMVLGLIAPTRGSVELFGKPVALCGPEEFRRVGVVLENVPNYPFLSGRDNLEVHARLAGADRRRVPEMLEAVGLGARANSKVRTYSLGMKQRLSLAAALLSDPDLLLLDEPTNGLDPNGMMEVRALIRDTAKRGKAILLSSHLLHEVQQVCTRVVILQRGRVLAQGPLEQVLRSRGAVIQVKVPDPETAMGILKQQPWATSVSYDGQYVLVSAEGDRGQDVSAALAKAGIYASELKYHETSLEDFFKEVTQTEGKKQIG